MAAARSVLWHCAMKSSKPLWLQEHLRLMMVCALAAGLGCSPSVMAPPVDASDDRADVTDAVTDRVDADPCAPEHSYAPVPDSGCATEVTTWRCGGPPATAPLVGMTLQGDACRPYCPDTFQTWPGVNVNIIGCSFTSMAGATTASCYRGCGA